MDATDAFAARTVRDGHAGCVYFPTFTRFSTCKVRKYPNRKCFTHPKNQSCAWSANELSSRITVARGRVSRRVDPHDVIVWLQGHVSTTQTELQGRTAAAMHLNAAFVLLLCGFGLDKEKPEFASTAPRTCGDGDNVDPGPRVRTLYSA